MQNPSTKMGLIIVVVAVITLGLTLLIQNATGDKLQGKLSTRPTKLIVLNKNWDSGNNAKMSLSACHELAQVCLCIRDSVDDSGNSCGDCGGSHQNQTCYTPDGNL